MFSVFWLFSFLVSLYGLRIGEKMSNDYAYPKSYEACAKFLNYLRENGWFKTVDGLYDEIPELQNILEDLFKEQEEGFKNYLRYKGID